MKPRLAAAMFLFAASGAAGLVYEVVWARSLGVVFGASHLAVATVLAVYMLGQALGSALFGNLADRSARPLQLYGVLELGIGASAVLFLALMRVYPHVYAPLARMGESHAAYLTAVRTLLAAGALLVPTTLMGGTLPVLAKAASGTGQGLANRLSLLYAVNIAGAIGGTALAGFVLLRVAGVTTTVVGTALSSAAIGAAALALGRQRRPSPAGHAEAPARARQESYPPNLALAAIGVSGFCALGYEVLWTRMLSLAAGTSVYAFTVILLAFLTGLAAGSRAFPRLCARVAGRGSLWMLGVTQLAIGLSAVAVTVLLRHLPDVVLRVQDVFAGLGSTEFVARTVGSSAVALAFVFVPAFFMGVAFPAAAAAYAPAGGEAGARTGRVLLWNTLGAAGGSIVSGFALLPFFGIERSLQMLACVNAALGCALVAAERGRRRALIAAPALGLALLVARAVWPDWGRAWDQKFFATWVNNTRVANTPDQIRERLANTDVLYYFEGVNETVSSIRQKGGYQSFIVNGRSEASTFPGDVQVQKTLGHLPVLLHPRPRTAFVLGTGTGMTLGAVAVHPEIERVVLGEIEPGMLGVARTFSAFNGRVLDSSKLSIVFNDGRNFLATTRERFDVISADPVHPWSGGAGYLYTAEYFDAVSDRLAPGGMACQWLPLYELTVEDVKSVLRTFSGSFAHVMVWLTHYDAVLIGSHAPIRIDAEALAHRLAVPAVAADLRGIRMETADDLLAYFLMGTAGARAFGEGGVVNTDDDLFLEFSAPVSQGVSGLDGTNVLALSARRESVLPWLVPLAREADESRRRELWTRRASLGRSFDQLHGRYLRGDLDDAAIGAAIARLSAEDPAYAPLQFLRDEFSFRLRTRPTLVSRLEAPVRDGVLTVSAVRQFTGRRRVLVSFVDNDRRDVFGERYLDGEYESLEDDTARFVAFVLAELRAALARTPGSADRATAAAILHREADRLVGQRPGRIAQNEK